MIPRTIVMLLSSALATTIASDAMGWPPEPAFVPGEILLAFEKTCEPGQRAWVLNELARTIHEA